MRIAHDLFVNAIPAFAARVDQPECGHTFGQPMNFRIGVAFFFGEEEKVRRFKTKQQ